MEKMPEILKIGDTFTYEGEQYVVRPEKKPYLCTGCAFDIPLHHKCLAVPNCNGVIFKLAE